MKNTKTSKSGTNNFLLLFVAWLTIASVGIGIVSDIGEGKPIWLAVLILIVIGLLQFSILIEKNIWGNVLYLSLITLLSGSFYFFDVNPGLYQVLFFVISAQSMMMLPIIFASGWIVLLALLSGFAFVLVDGVLNGILISLVYSGGYFFFGVFGYMLIESEEAREETQLLLSELELAHQQLQDYMQKAEDLVVSEERNRLAREMHDTVGHFLTTTSVQLQGAKRLVDIDPAKAVEMIELAQGQVSAAMTDLRRTVTVLRQPTEAGLSVHQSLERLIDSFSAATDISVKLSLPEQELDLPEAHRLMIYRIVQEGLTNIQKHANASEAVVDLALDDDRLLLKVLDDGEGIADIQENVGFGLLGIRERANQLGGSSTIERGENGGTALMVTIPYIEEQADE